MILFGTVGGNAVVHAGSTDYVFRAAEGVHLLVRIDNEAAGADGLEGFVALQADGPAEANPERIGRPYTLCFAGRVEAAAN